MTNKVYNWVEYETVYQVDAAVPAGPVKEGQNGYKGRNADTYRNLYDAEGRIQFDAVRKADRQYFLQHVNQNTVFFHDL